MSKMPTAEEFLQEHAQISHFYDDKTDRMVCFSDDVQKAMIEFAKLHVEAQTEAILKITHKNGIPRIVDNKDSILNSYPLTNIK